MIYSRLYWEWPSCTSSAHPVDEDRTRVSRSLCQLPMGWSHLPPTAALNTVVLFEKVLRKVAYNLWKCAQEVCCHAKVLHPEMPSTQGSLWHQWSSRLCTTLKAGHFFGYFGWGGNRDDHLCLETIKFLKANIEFVLTRDYSRPIFLTSWYEKSVH